MTKRISEIVFAMRHSSMMRRASWKTVAVVVLAACSSDAIVSADILSKISVSLASLTLVAGRTTQAYATLTAENGYEVTVTGDPVSWSSSNTAVAEIAKASGVITAIAPGVTTISASAQGRTASAELVVTADGGAVRSVGVSLASGTVAVGQTTQATAVATDANGDTITDQTISWSSSDANVAGVSASGIVTGVAPGTAAIVATSGGMTGSASVTVLPPSVVASVNVSLGSSTIQIGGVTQATVTARNAQGEVVTGLATSWATSDPGVASVSPTGSVTGVSLGTVTISATVDGRTASAPLTVAPPPVASISVVAPAQLEVGDTVTAVATLRDASNNVLTGRQVTWSVSNSAIASVSTGGLLRALAVGSTILTASSEGQTNNVLIRVVSASGGGGGGSALSITTQPSTTVKSGVDFDRQPVIQVRDSSNNPIQQAGIAVTAAIASGAGTLSGTTTVSTNASGVATFSNLRITGSVGQRTLNFSSGTLEDAVSSTITVTAGDASRLSVTTQPSSSVQSGAAFATQPVVQLRDASNNAVSQSGVTVTATIASGSGTLGGTVTATTNTSGVATFTNLQISGSGMHTLRFSASDAAISSVTSASIAVGAGTAAQLSITTQPSTSAASGAAFARQPVIQLRDASNNTVSQSGVVITASIATGGGTLGGTTTATTNASGVATFTNLSISGTAGDRTLLFSASLLTGVTSAVVAITPAPATKLLITTQPSPSVSAGAAFARQPVIQVADASNNSTVQPGVVVTATIASGGGTLGGTATATTDANGVAAFTNLSIGGTTGARTLRFSAASLTGVTSSSVAVGAGAASKLAVATQPSALAQTGVAFAVQPTVQVQDAWGNAVSQSGVTVTASVASGAGALAGTVKATTNASGLASFSDLLIIGDGAHTLQFVAPGLTAVTSNAITISLTAPVATQLTVTTQPSGSASSGVAFAQQPVIQLRDALGNPVGQSGVAVVASIGTGGGTLGGTTSVSTNSSGVATFTNLSITGADGSRTLAFTAGTLIPAISTTISVSSGEGATPWSIEDFSTYTNTANFLLNPRGVYQSNEDINTAQIVLDTTVGYGTSTKSMRYDYPDRTSQGGSGTSGRCTSYTISRSLKFPSKIQEVWIEIMVKTSTDFVTEAPSSWGCTSDEGLKFVDGNVSPGDRFSIGLRTGRNPPSSGALWFGYPNNKVDPAGKVPFSQSASATDGNWHQYRCYWKISTGYPDAANADGRITCWVDGKLVVDEPNIRTTSTAGSMPPSGFYGLALGRNVNQGPDHPQSLWWGQIKIYQTNPGW